MTGSEGKLNRLKDFMASNAEINIEIQGHVYMVGENSVSAQKLSEARAKRVLIYLADHGIDRNRMIAVGYGNTKPIYPNAKLAYEEQANRRVEIVVK
jgi:outer membrane protein OmpA-like peptidoglycan-associated protein